MGFILFSLYSIGCIVSAARDSIQRDGDPTHVIGRCFPIGVRVWVCLVMFFYVVVVVWYHSALIIIFCLAMLPDVGWFMRSSQWSCSGRRYCCRQLQHRFLVFPCLVLHGADNEGDLHRASAYDVVVPVRSVGSRSGNPHGILPDGVDLPGLCSCRVHRRCCSYGGRNVWDHHDRVHFVRRPFGSVPSDRCPASEGLGVLAVVDDSTCCNHHVHGDGSGVVADLVAVV